MKVLVRVLFVGILAFGLLNQGCKKEDQGDGTKPTIEILGSNPLYWAVGVQYVDPGAIAYDISSEGDTVDISSLIKTDINVDVVSEGDYTVVYNVTDESGLSADEKVRNVKVVVGK